MDFYNLRNEDQDDLINSSEMAPLSYDEMLYGVQCKIARKYELDHIIYRSCNGDFKHRIGKPAVFEGNDLIKNLHRGHFDIYVPMSSFEYPMSLVEYSTVSSDLELFKFVVKREERDKYRSYGCYLYYAGFIHSFCEGIDYLVKEKNVDLNSYYISNCFYDNKISTHLGIAVRRYQKFLEETDNLEHPRLPKLIKCLLQNGSDPNIGNCWKLAKGNEEIITLLNEFSQFPRTT